jgi:hypothetical protein
MLLLRWMHVRKLVPLMDLLEGGSGGAPTRSVLAPTKSSLAPTSGAIAPTSDSPAPANDSIAPAPGGGLKDKLLAEVRSTKNTLYSLAIAQAQRIDVADDRVTFTFASNQNVARGQLDQNREWLESVAYRLAGRRIQVISAQLQSEAASPATAKADASGAAKRDLKAEALSSSGVQAMLDVFPAEIRDVEEIP